jgi:transposase
MANKTIRMSRIRHILRLFTQGQSRKKISALTGTSRNTVKKYIARFIHEHLTFDVVNEMTDHELNLMFGYVEPMPKDNRHEHLLQFFRETEKELKRKGVTLYALFKSYKERYPTGYAVTQFYISYRAFARSTQPVMHLEHKAGDKAYIDFTGDKLSFTDMETGEVIAVEVFVAILGCSQLTFVEAVLSQKKEDLIKACENALHYFGGVPSAIVPDNLKSAVNKSSKYEPVINETFADFAEHYNTVVLPARAYKPKDKALVEGMVKIVYRTIFPRINMLVHTNLEDLNKAILHELEIMNTTNFKGRDYSRRQQFEEIERSSLQPLPVYKYEFRQQIIVTVMKNGHVCIGVDKHYYSVPYRFIGKKVKILYTSSRVEVFYHYERIAIHTRQHRKYHYTTMTEHLASSHQFLSDWTPEKFIEQAKAIHEHVAVYIENVIATKQHPEQAYKSCTGILSLQRKVGNERLINACKRASSYQVYNYPIILQILEKNLDHLSEWEQENLLQMPKHDNIRGPEYYE